MSKIRQLEEMRQRKSKVFYNTDSRLQIAEESEVETNSLEGGILSGGSGSSAHLNFSAHLLLVLVAVATRDVNNH